MTTLYVPAGLTIAPSARVCDARCSVAEPHALVVGGAGDEAHESAAGPRHERAAVVLAHAEPCHFAQCYRVGD